ncbi:MAG: hypothetical protein EA357_12255 [Micavibrio sp.]|nr:MAG: hypothetical protein EA357_12255 [Micavibrio sp.]
MKKALLRSLKLSGPQVSALLNLLWKITVENANYTKRNFLSSKFVTFFSARPLFIFRSGKNKNRPSCFTSAVTFTGRGDIYVIL